MQKICTLRYIYIHTKQQNIQASVVVFDKIIESLQINNKQLGFNGTLWLFQWYLWIALNQMQPLWLPGKYRRCNNTLRYKNKLVTMNDDRQPKKLSVDLKLCNNNWSREITHLRTNLLELSLFFNQQISIDLKLANT